jgi:hypothetical protein
MKPAKEHDRPSPGSAGGRRTLTALAILPVLLVPWSAAAAHAEVLLEYDRASDTASCSGPDQLRAAVAARLGYDPFVAASGAGTDTIAVHIRRNGSALEGTIERLDPARHARARPATIVSKTGDCTELAAALAVGIAIAIDPLSITREPSASPPAPTPPPQASAPPPAPTPVPAAAADRGTSQEPATPLTVAVGAAPSIAVGALPDVSFGVRALVGIGRGPWEVDLEGRFDAPVSAQTNGGSIQASLVLGTVAPCMRHWLAFACGVVSLGALRGTGLGFDHTREDNTFYIAAGARAGFEFPLGSRFAFRPFIEGQVPLRPTRLEAGGQPVWSTPAFEFAAVPMLMGRFP